MLDIDLDRDGKHCGWLYIPHSTNESGGGRIEIPLVSIRNGRGPRILCTAGVHGDEFEGQIVWSRLARRLDADHVWGQLIIMPAVNLPAALAGSRVSPLDQGNLNRLFPGDPRGTPSQRIAHAVEQQLIAGSDYMIDLHGGGNSMLFLSGPTITHSDDADLMARQVELLRIFGAPRGYIFDESGGGAGGTLGACRRHNVIRLGTEIGGGGLVSPADVRMMEAGVGRVLAHLGAVTPEVVRGLPAPHEPVILRRRNARSGAYLYTPEDGLFVPSVELGEEVAPGQGIGEMLWPESPDKPPRPIFAGIQGIAMARRRPGRAARGDCLLIIAQPESA